MAVLLVIDPNADKDSSIVIGQKSVPGQLATSMQAFGSEKVLSMRLLADNYDALGSYLHVQSMKQATKGVPLDFSKMRARFAKIATFVEQVLAS